MCTEQIPNLVLGDHISMNITLPRPTYVDTRDQDKRNRTQRGSGWVKTRAVFDPNFSPFPSHQPVIHTTFQSHYLQFQPKFKLWIQLNTAKVKGRNGIFFLLSVHRIEFQGTCSRCLNPPLHYSLRPKKRQTLDFRVQL